MSDFSDFFGEIKQIAAVTSSASSIISGTVNTVSRMSGESVDYNSPLNQFSQIANGTNYAIGNLANGISNLSMVGGSGDLSSQIRRANAGLTQLSNAAAMGSAIYDKLTGDSNPSPSITFQRGTGSMGGGGGSSGSGSASGGTIGNFNVGTSSMSDDEYMSFMTRSDWKVSVRCPGLNGKVVFPVTPQITITDTAKYSSAGLVHANYAMQFYESSEVSAIQIMADFPVQDASEGVQLLNCIYMFRAATKMFWGSDAAAGTPPPLVFLNGYGDGYLQDVPCVVTSFSHTMPEDKDYIYANGTRVPTMSQIQLQLQPVYSRNSLNRLSIAAVASGSMLNFI